MAKSAETELEQLKSAVDYLACVLEDGSLVAQYDQPIRMEIATTLRHLVVKVQGLPVDVPEYLIHAAAVRAIVEASEEINGAEDEKESESLEHHRRQAEVAANLYGHVLGQWEQISETGAKLEYQAICQNCRGIIYVTPAGAYELMLGDCNKVEKAQSSEDVMASDTIIGLWDLTQKEQE